MFYLISSKYKGCDANNLAMLKEIECEVFPLSDKTA